MILVTGAAGHLGNVLIRELLAQNQQVRAMILPDEDVSSLEGLNVELVEADVLQPATLETAMQGVDLVYHLAGIISILPGSEAIMEKVNVQGTCNVVEAAMKTGVRRMVHTSSIHAFKRMPHGVIVDENTPIAADSPRGTYDCTKANGTLVVRQAVARGLDAVIVCPTGVIGPYDFRNSEMGQTILNFSRRGLKLLVDGAYDFVDVRDVALSMILAARYGRTGETYILSGQRILVREILQIVHELVGNRGSSIVLPIKLADLFARVMEPIYTLTKRVPRFTRYSLQTLRDNSVFSHEKARRELGYNPRGLRHSIADTLEWWREREKRKKLR